MLADLDDLAAPTLPLALPLSRGRVVVLEVDEEGRTAGIVVIDGAQARAATPAELRLARIRARTGDRLSVPRLDGWPRSLDAEARALPARLRQAEAETRAALAELLGEPYSVRRFGRA